MLRNKYFVSLVALLFIVIVVYNINFFTKRYRPHFKSSMITTITRSEKIFEAKALSPVKKDNSRWRRDPFIHSGDGLKERLSNMDKKKVDKENLILQGIMGTKGQFYALINGWIVKKGDRIEGMVIEDISPDSVLLKDGNTQKMIKLE